MNKAQIKVISDILHQKLIPKRADVTSTQVKSLMDAVISVCDDASNYNQQNDMWISHYTAEKAKFKKDKVRLDKAIKLMEGLSDDFKEVLSKELTSLPVHYKILIEIGVSQPMQKWNNLSLQYANSFLVEQLSVMEKVSFEDKLVSNLAVRGCINLGSSQEDGRGSSRYDFELSFAYHLRLTIEKWLNNTCNDFTADNGDELSDDTFYCYDVLKSIGSKLLNIDEGFDYSQTLSVFKKSYPDAYFTSYSLQEQ